MDDHPIKMAEHPPIKRQQHKKMKQISLSLFILLMIIILFRLISIFWPHDLHGMESALGGRNAKEEKILQMIEDQYGQSFNSVNHSLNWMKQTLGSDFKHCGIQKSIPNNSTTLMKEFKGFKDFMHHMQNERVPQKAWKLIFNNIQKTQPYNWGTCLNY